MKCTTKTITALLLIVTALGSMPTAHAQVSPNDPIAYWSFDNSENMLSNLVISTPCHDATVLKGNPESGIHAGGAGIVGNAMVLDGASGIRLPYHQDNLGTNFTISLWYWQATNDTLQCVYQSRDNFVATYEAILADYMNEVTYAAMIEDGYTAFNSYAGQLKAGETTTYIKEWVHVTHTFATEQNMTTLCVYTNGFFQYSASVNADNMFKVNQLIGLHVGVTRYIDYEGGRCFKGMIDELALWARVLSADEVLSVYQRGKVGDKLEYTAQSAPAITLPSGQREFYMRANGGLPDGMFNNGWLLSDYVERPGGVFDTAGAATRVLGSTMPDTANHAGGPFNAEKTGPAQWRVPLTDGSALKTLPQGDFTVEAWFNTTTLKSHVLIGNYPANNKGVINLQLWEKENYMYIRSDVSSDVGRVRETPPGEKSFTDGAWHHLAGIRRGATGYLYLDGTLIKSNAIPATSYDLSGDYLYLGRDGRSQNLFEGEIGDVRLWSRALSSNEVLSIAQEFGRPGGSVSKSNLVAEYALYNPYQAFYTHPISGHQVKMSPQLRQIPQSNFTYEVKFRTDQAERCILIGNYDGSILGVNSLELTKKSENKIRFVQHTPDDIGLYISRAPETVDVWDNKWHRAAAVRRGEEIYLYLDGEQMGAPASKELGSYALLNSHLGFGRDFRWGTFPLKGALDQARVWSRALSADEVAGLAASNAVPRDGLIIEYAPFPTNTLRTAGFPSNRFLRSWTTGPNSITLTFSKLPRHNKIGISALLAQLDSLEPQWNNDRFVIKIDGMEALSVGLGPNQGSEPQVYNFSLFGQPTASWIFKETLTVGGEDLFDGGQNNICYDHVYDLSNLDALREIPHTDNTLTIELIGVQNRRGNIKGFGIDKIRVIAHPPLGTLIMIY